MVNKTTSAVTDERQFIESYSLQAYPEETKARLKLYINGMGFRAIETVNWVNHNTVINWVKFADSDLPTAPQAQEIPEITQVDELKTFVKKKQNLAVDNSE